MWVMGLTTQVGCYTYMPATLETVPDGARVRALITPAAEQRLQPFGVRGTLLAGDLQGRTGDSLSLLVPSVPMSSSPESRLLYQQVVVSSSDILRLDVRRVDGFRTGVAVGVAAVAAGFITVQALGGWVGATSGGDGSGPPESVRGWVLRIPISWP
jgi:hypothetical protein